MKSDYSSIPMKGDYSAPLKGDYSALGVVPSERKCDGEGDSPFALGACKSL